VGTTTTTTTARLCDFCPGHTELRHAPCPGADDPGGDHTVFFAVQTVDLGADRTEWFADNTLFAAGLDLDCSLRDPNGAPVWCNALSGAQWTQPLPFGVDNAFAQQVLAPLLTPEGDASPTGGPVDVSAAVNAWLTAGHGGFVIVVDHWNLQPDDAQVGLRIVQAVGPVGGGAPTFTADEQWVVYEDGWDPDPPVPTAASTSIVTSSAYVVGGNLVADLRSAGGVELRLGAGPAALAKLQPAAVEVYGQILPPAGSLPATIDELSVAGVLLDPDRDVDAYGLAQVAAASAPDAAARGCLPQYYCAENAVLAPLLARGRDMPSQLQPSPGTVCDSMSFGIRLYATQIAGVSLSSANLQSCPFSCEDAGAGDGQSGDAGHD
jgi:hypothetical protein